MADRPTTGVTAVARLAAAAAREVPDVLDLHGGTLGEVATYGQGTKVRGVRVEREPPRVRVHTIMRFGARMDDVAEEVRRRVRATLSAEAPLFADAAVDVHIADVGEVDHAGAGLPAASRPELA